MSRQPPMPPASKPTHGPDAVPKTSVDITHRVRHAAERARREVDRPREARSETARWIPALVCAVALGALVALVGTRRTAT